MNMQRREFLLALVGGLSIAVPDAQARGRIRFRGTGLARGARHNGPVLSREQLRQCVAQQNQLNAGIAELDNIEASLQDESAELKKLETLIAQRERLVDVYSQQSVDDFNALVLKHRKLVQSYNAKLPAFNSKADQNKTMIDSFNAQCAAHAYYESDMQAVLAGR